MKSIEYTPPYAVMKHKGLRSVFLAGSIEMGSAVDWQQYVISKCPDGFSFLNPRRRDWDSSWKQEIGNPQFYGQVTWELDNLDDCDIIFLYFDPKTKSPISLLELGLHINHPNLIVCCPHGFWRKGNVDIVCSRHNVYVFDDLDEAIANLKIDSTIKLY